MKTINTKNLNVVHCPCGTVIEYETSDFVLEQTEKSTPYYAIGVKCPSCGTVHPVDAKEYDGSALIASLKNKGKRFADLSPKEILEVFEKGKPEEVFSVNDRRYITLTNGYVAEIAPIGIYHDTMESGDLAPMTIGFVALYGTDDEGGMNMNNECSNKGGWEKSLRRQWLNNDFYDLLPEEWKEVLVPVVKTTADSNGKLKKTVDKVFLPSEVEVFGEVKYSSAGEGEQYEFFKDWHNRIKGYSDGNYGRWWWLRSPYSGNANNFCNVDSNGSYGNYSADSACGVSPCFAIGINKSKNQQTEVCGKKKTEVEA